MSNKTQQAFPQDPHAQVPGMTYRQWLVGMAMQGLLAGREWNGEETLASIAVEIADAVQAEEAK